MISSSIWPVGKGSCGLLKTCGARPDAPASKIAGNLDDAVLSRIAVVMLIEHGGWTLLAFDHDWEKSTNVGACGREGVRCEELKS